MEPLIADSVFFGDVRYSLFFTNNVQAYIVHPDTEEESAQWAQCVAVKGEKIVFVGCKKDGIRCIIRNRI
jgi:hypothetical protein